MSATEYTARMEVLAGRGWVPQVAPPKLRDTDIPRAGYDIHVGEDEMHAVMDVEAPGGGYDKQGRLTILYEPHIAYRIASAPVRAKLVAAGLAYPKWGEKPYPKESYSRFTAAYRIDPDVAVQACSLGRGQVLGSNFAVCGFKSPIEMYVKMAEGGEAVHLRVMVAFIKGNHLDDELRNHNWAGFARGYNGPKYAVNQYHTKLAARYAWWAKIPDTPWSPSMIDQPAVVLPTPAAPAPAAPSVIVVTPRRPAPVVTPVVVAPAPTPAQPAMPGTSPASIRTPAAAPKKIGLYRRFAAWFDDIFYRD